MPDKIALSLLPLPLLQQNLPLKISSILIYILNNLKETRQVLGSLSSALFGYSPIFWRQASLHHHISTKVPDQCNYLSPALGLPHNIPAQRAGRGKVRNKKIPQKLSPSAPCPHNIKQTLGPHQHHADISHLFLFNLP